MISSSIAAGLASWPAILDNAALRQQNCANHNLQPGRFRTVISHISLSQELVRSGLLSMYDIHESHWSDTEAALKLGSRDPARGGEFECMAYGFLPLPLLPRSTHCRGVSKNLSLFLIVMLVVPSRARVKQSRSSGDRSPSHKWMVPAWGAVVQRQPNKPNNPYLMRFCA